MAGASLLGLRFLFGFALLAVGPSVVWDLLRSGGLDPLAVSEAERMEWGMVAFVAAAVAVVLFARWQPAAPWRPCRPGSVLRSYAAFVLPWVAFLLAYLWAARALGSPVMAQDFLRYLAAGDAARPGFWLVVAGVVVGAPLAEEIVFRGYLQGALQGVLGRGAAIAFAAAVFGLCHTLPYALPVGLLGALFGWLFARHGCLWPNVLAHAVHNGLTVLVTVLWPGSVDLLYPR